MSAAIRRIVYVTQRDTAVWNEAKQLADRASMSMSQVVIAGLRLWIKRRQTYYSTEEQP